MPRLHRVTDAILIERLRTGDPAAFAAIYDRHATLAYTVAFGVCRHREMAEDALQQAFLEVWRTVPRFDERCGSLSSWIMTIVRHRSIDALRRQAVPGRRLVADGVGHEPASGDDVTELAGGRADAALVRKALRRLPLPQRTALALAYDDDLSHPEIAARLDIPLGTVKSRTRLGLATLRLTPEMHALAR